LAVSVADEVGPTATSSNVSKFKVRPTDRAGCWMAWRPWLTERASSATTPSSKLKTEKGMVACNCSPKGWIAATNKKGPADPLAAHQPPMSSASAHHGTVTKGAGSTRLSTVTGPGNWPGHCPKRFGGKPH
jgi:hypothetical protein